MLGQAHRGKGHGHRAGADLGFGAHFFGNRKGALKELVEHQGDGASGLGRGKRLFDLTEDLWLAQHQGIQATRDTHQVIDRIDAFVVIQALLQLRQRHLVVLLQPVDQGIPLGLVAIEFGTITR